MHVIKTEEMKVPILCWCENPEQAAIDQAMKIATLPFVYGKVCLMPDTHVGYTLPIGGVVVLKNVISPAMVGVDIACGMCSIRTSLQDIDACTLKKIMGKIRSQIPLGRNHHKESQDSIENIFEQSIDPNLSPVVAKESKSATYQLGTLGGGNHFIEIQKGSDGFIYAMLHSGSRNLGKKVCDYYCDLGKIFNEKWFSTIPSDVPFFPIDDKFGQMYWLEMNLAMIFARKSRKLMMQRIMAIFNEETGCSFPDEIIDIHHNYADVYKTAGVHNNALGLIIHRKGATNASLGTIGLIPGSQGTSSYIVKGKGSSDSFESCSHGAGRKLGRMAACRDLDLVTEQAKMDANGIIHSLRSKSDLEEAPGAYKDIEICMAEQSDLVEILVKLQPLAVIKE